MIGKALLLVGSPKPRYSTSESLGDYLIGQLEQKGFTTEKIKINQAIRTDSGKNMLVSSVNECDLLIFSFPLYVDSTPSSLIKAMELIADLRRGKQRTKKQVLLAICNSGFPEAHQIHTALAILKCFAKEAGFIWAGGLSLGGGGAIGGKPLNALGGMVRNVVKGLDLTAIAIAEGSPVPEEAIKLMAKPFIPHWLYLMFGQLSWRKHARKYGTHKNLNDRPYQ